MSTQPLPDHAQLLAAQGTCNLLFSRPLTADGLPAAGLAAELGAAGGHAAGALPRHAARRLPGPGAALHPHPALQRGEQRLQRQHRRSGRRLQHHHLRRVRHVSAFSDLSSFMWIVFYNVTLKASLPWRGRSC